MYQNPVISIGGLSVYMYGVMIACGILACFLTLFIYSPRMGIDARYVDFAFYDGVGAIVAGFFGAALGQGIFNYIHDLQSGVENPTFSLSGGLTVISGILVGAATFIVISLIFRKYYPYTTTKLVQIAPCCITVAHAFGRLGCLFAGCCYGKPVQDGDLFGFLGVSFPEGSLHKFTVDGITMRYDGRLVYPTQLFESVFLFVLFGILSYLVLKKKFRYSMVVYMVAYGIWRFLIEFVRGDYRGSLVEGLTPSQTQSLLIVAAAVAVYFLLRFMFKKEEEFNNKLASEALAAEVSEEVDQTTQTK